MSHLPEVTVTIKDDGTISVDVGGVKGTGCDALTKAIEEALGNVTAKQRKPEYNLKAETSHGLPNHT